MDQRPRVAMLYGPTGIGKTALGVEIAEAVGGEVISADSLAVYRGMDIGTAKPTVEERRGIPHHLIDVVSPDEPFSAADFRLQAGAIIEELHRRRVPILVVGGTGLYIRALSQGLFKGPDADVELRAALEAEEEAEPGRLHRRLQRVDPSTAARLHPNDRLRLVRALEVYQLTGRPLSAWVEAHRFKETAYRCHKIGLLQERGAQVKRLGARVEEMMAQGLLAEVQGLLDLGYGPELKPMRALGYVHMCRHLVGGEPLDLMVQHLKRDTRRYARRQRTWMNSEPQIQRRDIQERAQVRAELIAFLRGEAP